MIGIERPTGQWFTADDGRRWWFESGALCLDFAYTGGMGDGRAEWERWHRPEHVASWLQERFPEIDGSVTDRDFVDARTLRAAIATSFTAIANGGGPAAVDVDVINLFAATPDIPPVLAGGSRQAGRMRVRTAQALSSLARQAVVLLGPEHRERIRECSGETCAIVYYDESRSGSRRWCSMQRCGNRAKVRRHRALQKNALQKKEEEEEERR